MLRLTTSRLVVTAGCICALAIAGCSSTPSSTPTVGAVGAAASTQVAPAAQYLNGVIAPPGWTISVWARGGPGVYYNPDSIEQDGPNIWVTYQNASVKDGSKNSLLSTIVQYTLDGKVVKMWSVPGHSDGMRVDPATHKVWVTSNEDGGPLLNIIDPSNPTPQSITLPALPHGGGIDDLAFVGGATYIALSNPTLDANGNNVFPAVDKITVTGSTATMTTVLMGNATATDSIAKAPVTLNLTDPDSMTTDINGNLILVSQGDSAIITIQNPGSPSQKVMKTPVGNQEDDTVWTTSPSGDLLVTDAAKNVTYSIEWKGAAGTVITEAPNDSGVVGFVGTIDMSTGFITPVVVGMGKPTGMIFIPNTTSGV
jgi:sugar lactone lactonase YvrE